MKPKIATYALAIGSQTPDQQAMIAKSNLLVYAGRPEVVSNLRLQNPGLKWAWKMIPQFVDPWDEKWLKDTLWSPLRRWQRRIAQFPEWRLSDVRGEPIINAQGQYIVNWTPYCPYKSVWVAGESREVRASQYLAYMVQELAMEEHFWPKWGWHEENTINAIAFDVLADCLGTIGPTTLSEADPDGDHIAEGVSKVCSGGGNMEPLSGLMRIENYQFYRLLKSRLVGIDLPIILGDASKWTGPIWYPRADGFKLENWMRVHDWNEWWTGANRGVGYDWAHHTLAAGSEFTMIYVLYQQDKDAAWNIRRMMFGLCTALLHDGYFVWTEDEHYPLWHQVFDMELGDPIGEPVQSYGGGNVWGRRYTRYTVWVDVDKQEGRIVQST